VEAHFLLHMMSKQSQILRLCASDSWRLCAMVVYRDHEANILFLELSALASDITCRPLRRRVAFCSFIGCVSGRKLRKQELLRLAAHRPTIGRRQ